MLGNTRAGICRQAEAAQACHIQPHMGHPDLKDCKDETTLFCHKASARTQGGHLQRAPDFLFSTAPSAWCLALMFPSAYEQDACSQRNDWHCAKLRAKTFEDSYLHHARYCTFIISILHCLALLYCSSMLAYCQVCLGLDRARRKGAICPRLEYETAGRLAQAHNPRSAVWLPSGELSSNACTQKRIVFHHIGA